MQTASSDGRAFLLQRIERHLQIAEGSSRRLRRVNFRLVAASLCATALATLIAGLTTATGPLVGAGPSAWRWTCGVVALITALSGVLTGLLQHLRLQERSAEALACVGRLRALQLALGLSRRDPGEVAQEYEELLAQYPELAGD